MKKGISFERIVVVFVIVLIIIFIINALDPDNAPVFSKSEFVTSNTNYLELENKSFNALPLNITIFIDPSSRIDKSGVIDRDTNIIRETISQFLCRTHGTKLNTIKQFGNHFQVIVHPSSGIVDMSLITHFTRTINNYNPNPNNLSLWGRIFNQKHPIEESEYTMDSLKRALFDNEILNLSKYYSQLEKAKDRDGNRIGSDIYGFMDKDLFSKNVIRRGSRNVLFILTDGWVDYRPTRRDFDNSKSEIYYLSNEDSLRKKSLIYQNLQFNVPHDYKNDSLEIYVFGISNSYNTIENNDLHRLWETWLSRMVGDGKYRVFDFNKGDHFQEDIFKILDSKNEGKEGI
jgi:hypothetical protein